MPSIPQYGLHRDRANSRVALNYAGTRRLSVNGTGVSVNGTTTSSGALTVTTGGLTVTAGGLVVTASDAAITAGNLRLGVISAFATTQPTSAVVMKTGTAPAGAITTSSGIFASATVLQKIIADGTVSNVET